ncbi:hypothetical protein V3C99_000890 [Haemonchus contortus]
MVMNKTEVPQTQKNDIPDMFRNPLFWSVIAQCLLAVVIFVTTMHVWFTTKTSVYNRMMNLNYRLQLVQRRLRLQEPNKNIVEQMARESQTNEEPPRQDVSKLVDCIVNSRKFSEVEIPSIRDSSIRELSGGDKPKGAPSKRLKPLINSKMGKPSGSTKPAKGETASALQKVKSFRFGISAAKKPETK